MGGREGNECGQVSSRRRDADDDEQGPDNLHTLPLLPEGPTSCLIFDLSVTSSTI